MIWAKIVGDLGQIRNNLGHRFGPKNTKFRAKNVYLSYINSYISAILTASLQLPISYQISAAQKNGFKVLLFQLYLVFSGEIIIQNLVEKS